MSTANYKGHRMSKMMSNKYQLFAIFERRTFWVKYKSVQILGMKRLVLKKHDLKMEFSIKDFLHFLCSDIPFRITSPNCFL